MPFCEECAKYWAPSAMNADGTCPTCGRPVEQSSGPTAAAGSKSVRELAGKEAKAPWHFKLLVAALIGYLGWRLVQLVGLL
jgi:hypothetical protein